MAKVRTGIKSWGYLGLFTLLMLSCGSFFSFSFWKAGFLKYYTEWDRDDLNVLFQLGGIGAFICIIPGGIYDKWGPRVTFGYSFVLNMIGFAGILATMQLAERDIYHTPSWVVGIFYLIEEQGAASYYMAGCCYLIHLFSDKLVPVAAGTFAVAYGMSSLLWQNLLPLFGFSEEDESSLKLHIMMYVICGSMNFFGLIAWIVCSPGKDDHKPAAPHRDASSKKHGKSYFAFVCRLDFIAVFLFFGIASVHFAAFFGYLSSVPTAFKSIDSDIFTNVCFLSNVFARLLFGGIGMLMVTKFGQAGNAILLFFFNLCWIGFFGLFLYSVKTGKEANGMAAYIVTCMAFMGYGGAGPVMSSHVNLCFDPAKVGVIVGIIFTVVALMNFGVAEFGPTNVNHSTSIDRVAKDFEQPFLVGFGGCCLALPATLWLLIKKLKDRKVHLNDPDATHHLLDNTRG